MVANKAAIRMEVYDEIIEGLKQYKHILESGGEACLTGHEYDPKDNDREIALLNLIIGGLADTRDKQ